MDQEIQAAQERLLQKRQERQVMIDRTQLMPSIDEPLEAILERVGKMIAPSSGNGEQEPKVIITNDDKRFLGGVSTRYLKCSFDNFTGNDRLVSDLRNIGAESVVLSGGTGCGKTHLAVAIMRHLQIKYHSHFTTVPELLLTIRATFNREGGECEDDLITRYANYKLLILDDLGAEKSTEFSITTLYLIIDRRNGENRQTIITTNLTLEQIEQTLGARIASRLAEMKFIKIGMRDYRKNRG